MELIAPIWDCAKCSSVNLKRQINYIKNIRENFEILKDKAGDLDNRKADIIQEVNRDSVLKNPSVECEAWLTKVHVIQNQVNEIEKKFNENKRCISGWCPEIWSCFKLGKCVVITTQKITEMIEASSFRGVVVHARPRTVELKPMPTIKGNTSSDRTMQKLLGCIMNDNFRKIGVRGMGGVGKTTIMKSLNNLPEIKEMFQIVIWVTVSKDWSLRNVQNEIAQRLSLAYEIHESCERIASKICEKLMTMKYLLLLDDLWDKIELEEVGIPSPSKENGCKIVLTTRSLYVCKMMSTDEDIEVEVLSEEEAWDLFYNKVGDVVDDQNIQTLARDVVKECGGLPLMVIVTGGSLRKENDVCVWRYALNELKRATFDLHDMEESVFKRLKFSYDRLKTKNIKSCFLYCSAYPEDFLIDANELITFWWAEGFIDGVRNMGEAFDKGHAILNDLTSASLLERIEDSIKVKMHDVIRDLALKITSCIDNMNEDGTLCKFLVREEPREEDEWKQVERLSLMYQSHNSDILSRVPKCTSFRTLLAQHNRGFSIIPESFFIQVPNLRVLNLSGTHVTKLPIQIGYLKRLEVLHLGRGFKYLPSEIMQLTRLKSLRVSFSDYGSSDRVMIPNGVLANLSLLEDLRLDIARSSEIEQISSKIEEVVSLKYLNCLKFPFSRMQELELFFEKSCSWNDKQLKWFYFTLGNHTSNFRSNFEKFSAKFMKNPTSMRIFYLDGLRSSSVGNFNELSIQKVFHQCSAFTIQHLQTIKNLFDVANMESMTGLKFCEVIACSAIETIFDVSSCSSSSLPITHAIFPDLEEMRLLNLPNLMTIWDWNGSKVPPQSLTSLRRLDLEGCMRLINVFSPGTVQQLCNLEELFIRICGGIENIVNEEKRGMAVVNADDQVVPVVLFPRLKTLELRDLENLVLICNGISKPISWPSLETLYLGECDKLQKFPLSIRNAPVLRMVRASMPSMQWEDDLTTEAEFTRQNVIYAVW